MLGVETAYYVSRALDVNYAALAYAIYSKSEVSPDYAIAQIINDPSEKKTKRDAQTLELIRLREQGYSYRTIAKMTGIDNDSTVFHRIKRWRENHADRQ